MACRREAETAQRADMNGGIEAYPEVLNALYSGGNLGKLVLTD